MAILAQDEADQLIQTTRHQLVRTEQLIRIPIALILVGGWFIILWQRRGLHAGSILIAAIITISLYHGLYQLQGYSYSLSSWSTFSILPLEVARRVAISLFVGGGILMIFLMLTGEGRWTTLLGSTYGFSVLVTFAFTLPFFWGYWQNGLLPVYYLPNVDPLFWQILAALEGVSAAALGLLLPWPIAIFSYSVNLARRRLGDTRPQHPKPDALPGLHL